MFLRNIIYINDIFEIGVKIHVSILCLKLLNVNGLPLIMNAQLGGLPLWVVGAKCSSRLPPLL